LDKALAFGQPRELLMQGDDIVFIESHATTSVAPCSFPTLFRVSGRLPRAFYGRSVPENPGALLFNRKDMIMSSNQVVPLFGGHTTQQGQKITGSLVRQTKREVEQVAASTEIAAVREQGHAFLASQALTNVATLVSQAEAQMKIAPAGAQFYEAIIAGYAIGAGQRIARGL
jgi:hypothetical protein